MTELMISAKNCSSKADHTESRYRPWRRRSSFGSAYSGSSTSTPLNIPTRHKMLSQVEPMIPALRRYAWGLLGDVETADDIVQDCLEKVVGNWKHRRNYDARSLVFSILSGEMPPPRLFWYLKPRRFSTRG
jgi:hypothetical protein